MNTIFLDTVDSTNTWVKAHAADIDNLTMVLAREQTAGRGQRGNSWESEPGANLTFTVLIRPEQFEAPRQFGISEAVALGITDALKELYDVDACVKWPNDIYVGDKKICGILIEHSLSCRFITQTIIGAGININQEQFFSDAPNPVSVRQLTGQMHNLDKAAKVVADCLEERLSRLALSPSVYHDEFMRKLWRGSGQYPFHDRLTGRRYFGSITAVDADGTLHISENDGTPHAYAFKEVEFLLQI